MENPDHVGTALPGSSVSSSGAEDVQRKGRQRLASRARYEVLNMSVEEAEKAARTRVGE